MLLLAACASEPTPVAADQQAQQPKSVARICDRIAVTGSNINHCDRSGVQLVSPEAFSERMNTPSGHRIGD